MQWLTGWLAGRQRGNFSKAKATATARECDTDKRGKQVEKKKKKKKTSAKRAKDTVNEVKTSKRKKTLVDLLAMKYTVRQTERHTHLKHWQQNLVHNGVQNTIAWQVSAVS